MSMYKNLIFTFLVSVFVIITGCNSTTQESVDKLKICPQCHMELPKSNKNTAFVLLSDKTIYFDDVGCMILWAKEHDVELKNITAKVFTNDTKKYLDAYKLNYRIDEKTPMNYGFGAYESKQERSIGFDEVILKMLRGEHMANPKIRKQILGY